MHLRLLFFVLAQIQGFHYDSEQAGKSFVHLDKRVDLGTVCYFMEKLVKELKATRQSSLYRRSMCPVPGARQGHRTFCM